MERRYIDYHGSYRYESREHDSDDGYGSDRSYVMSDGSRRRHASRLVIRERHDYVTQRTSGLRLSSRETYATEVARRYGWGVNSNTHVVRFDGSNHLVRSRSSTSRTNEGRSGRHQSREMGRSRANTMNDNPREPHRSRQSRNNSDQPDRQMHPRDRVETWLRDTHRHTVQQDRSGTSHRRDQRHPLNQPRDIPDRASERSGRRRPSHSRDPPHHPRSRPSSHGTAHDDISFVTPPRPGTVRTLSSTETTDLVGDRYPQWYSNRSDE